MRSQRPEHALVALLRQCFVTPRCQVSRAPLRTIHGQRTCTNAQRRHPLSIGRPRKGCYNHARSTNDGYSASFSSTASDPATAHFQACQPKHTEQQSNIATHKRGLPQNDDKAGIAILGGGVTGLASAYYLARELPNTNITIYEGSGRVGGWLRSKRFDVKGGQILFEQGPRTLRPEGSVAGLTTLELVSDLKLKDQLIVSYKDSDAARNRFIYYPDHLVKMPGPGQDMYDMLWRIFTEPIFKGLLWGVMTEGLKPPRSSDVQDESIGHWFERRLGTSSVPDNMLSAVLHGIYAGDVYQLSMKSLMPTLWHMEKAFDAIARAPFSKVGVFGSALVSYRDVKLRNELAARDGWDMELPNRLHNASVYTFKEGISALSGALEASLRSNPRVQFKTNTQIKSLEYDNKSDAVKVITTCDLSDSSKSFHKVISTISGQNLSALAPAPDALPSLAAIHSVSVMVVNLFFSDPNILPERGFGYLIPRSVPFDQNPEMALGVVFDSDATPGQDAVPGTKVTVMLGGHWWDSWSESDFPSEAEAENMARNILARHLKIHDEPELVKAALHKNCIPQYTVGHESRMKKAHTELMVQWKGKVAVAGNSYSGVGLNDCVRSARDVVMGYKEDEDLTGLEHFLVPTQWVQQGPNPGTGLGARR
ncbi:hypothetical protein BGZ60DRAFT_483701 [Tricladium varicosporioides]|nr:hypothetical protein BGZ60DRAFT_483701 [Hymenoscyphus varicosporioides]